MGVGDEAPSDSHEVRTLPVWYDARGERFSLWREVANAVECDSFLGCLVEGQMTMQWLAKFWTESGGLSTPAISTRSEIAPNKIAETLALLRT